MVAKPLCPLYKNIIKPLDRVRYPELRYDWLGNGIYFWENNEERAWLWAKDLAKRRNSQVKEPAVVGAIIDLGYCFDLTDSSYLQELKDAYESMVELYKESGLELPKNTSIGKSTDLLIRKLDCAVVQTA